MLTKSAEAIFLKQRTLEKVSIGPNERGLVYTIYTRAIYHILKVNTTLFLNSGAVI